MVSRRKVVVVLIHMSSRRDFIFYRAFLILGHRLVRASVSREDKRDSIPATDPDQNIDDIALDYLSNASKKIDCYLNPLPKFGSADDIRNLMEFIGASGRKKLQIRIITKVTKDNVVDVEQLLKYCEVYHIEGIEGNFYIIDDTGYLYYSNSGQPGFDKEQNQNLISNYRKFIEMQQYIFDDLLSRSVPAKDKAREIERGVQSEFIETLRDPLQALEVAGRLVRNSIFEVQVLFSTVNSFRRAEAHGILDLLGQASSRGVSVRVLIKVDDEEMKDASKEKVKQKHDRISVAFIEKAVKSKITTIVVDQTYSLALEISDDSKDDIASATGLSTFSNSESTVFTYYSMFENLWIQAELEKQSKVKHAYFHIFKEQKMKDEVYRRTWTVGKNKDGKD